MMIPAVVLLAASPAFAEAPLRVRGIVTRISDGSINVKERDGNVVRLKTRGDTAYACLVPSSPDAIKVNDFVGTAVKGALSSMVAVELAIIPENMQKGRISLYDWDPLPDPTARHTSGTTATRMINGLVSNASPTAPRGTNTYMTSGIVSAEKGGSGGRILTVTYDGGSRRFQIAVPANAPVVRYVLADRTAVVVGALVMIKTNPGDQAGLVSVGKGVAPPM